MSTLRSAYRLGMFRQEPVVPNIPSLTTPILKPPSARRRIFGGPGKCFWSHRLSLSSEESTNQRYFGKLMMRIMARRSSTRVSTPRRSFSPTTNQTPNLCSNIFALIEFARTHLLLFFKKFVN